MARFLKRGMDASAIKAADAQVRSTVEGILAQVEDKKDAAIRELSKKFDNWEPKDFRLTPAEIDTMLGRLTALSDDHFETHPDEINWGHAGTLKHYAGLLRQITDSAFKEGEHAA